MSIDPIANFISIIKNGYLAKKAEVKVPASKFKENLAKVLVKEGFLENVKTEKIKDQFVENLILTLKYEGKKPVLTDIQRVSKPGLRVYLGKAKIPKVLGGLGIVVMSTPEGLMTGQEAKAKNLGGEAICKIW